MDVPFVDLDAAYRELDQPMSSAARRVLGSSRYILGPEVAEFEQRFAAYVGAKHCVGVGNGLDALMLSLAALGIGPGDEVIVPAATFVATWLAVSRLGATPVPAAVADATLTLDPLAFEAAVSDRTRAVVPVHLYGHPADLGAIGNIARAHGVHVVDDAAQAHGARYRGRPIGALASATAFSFYPTKNLGAVGDGGAVTTNDRSIADRVRMLGNYGTRQKHVSESLGWNSRLDPIQAAILQVKLDKLDEWNSRRRRAAARYREGLSGLGWVRLPSEASWATHVYHLFVIRVSDREGLARHLAANSIATAVHYPVPPYRQPAYRNLTIPAPLEDLDVAHSEVLSLPIGPHLSNAQVDHVVDAVSSFGIASGSRVAMSQTSLDRRHARQSSVGRGESD